VAGSVKIAFVIDSLGSGGAQRQLVELAAHLQQNGAVRCAVVVYHAEDFFGPRLREAGIPVLRLAHRRRIDPALVWQLRGTLRQLRPDLVHAFLLAPCLWTLAALALPGGGPRPRFLAAERNSRIASSPGEYWLQKLVYGFADAVTVNAAAVGPMIHQRLGIPREQIHVLPNGIDLERWDRAAAEPCPLSLEPEHLHIGVLAGLRPAKNHEALIRALEQLGAERTRGWRVWCIGDETGGPAFAEQLRRRAARSPIAGILRFLPAVSNPAPLLRALDLLVLPSLWEGFPNVVLEASASRIPVLATSVGAAPELILDGVSGRIVAPGDEGELAQALLDLGTCDPATRREMGEAGRRHVERAFSLPQVARRYLELYGQLAKPAHHAL